MAVCKLACDCWRCNRIERAGNDRDMGRLGLTTRLDFPPHALHRLGCRPDEDQAGCTTLAGKLWILGQKTVAWMDCPGVGSERGGNDRSAVEITFCCRSRADQVGVVCIAYVQRRAICFGVDRNDPQT